MFVLYLYSNNDKVIAFQIQSHSWPTLYTILLFCSDFRSQDKIPQTFNMQVNIPTATTLTFACVCIKNLFHLPVMLANNLLNTFCSSTAEFLYSDLLQPWHPSHYLWDLFDVNAIHEHGISSQLNNTEHIIMSTAFFIAIIDWFWLNSLVKPNFAHLFTWTTMLRIIKLLLVTV